MQDKFIVDIYLIIVAVEADPSKREQSRFLVIKNDNQIYFPHESLKKINTTKDIARHLLLEYTGITENWAIIFPYGVVDDVNPEKENIAVLYGVFIPEATRIRKSDSHWVTYNDLYNILDVSEFTKKLAYEAIWRQV